MIDYNADPTYLDFNFEGYITTDQIKISDRVASHIHSGLSPKLETSVNRSLLQSSPSKLPSEYGIASAIRDVLNNSVLIGKNTLDNKTINNLIHIFKETIGMHTIFYDFIVDENSKHRLHVDIDILTSNIILTFNGRRSSATGIRIFDSSKYIEEDFANHYTDNKEGGINQGIYNNNLIIPTHGWDIQKHITIHPYILYLNNYGKKSQYWKNKNMIISKIMYKILEPFSNPGHGETLKLKVKTSWNDANKKYDDLLGTIEINNELNVWQSNIEYSNDIKTLGYFRISEINQIGLERSHSFNTGKIQLKIFYDLVSAAK